MRRRMSDFGYLKSWMSDFGCRISGDLRSAAKAGDRLPGFGNLCSVAKTCDHPQFTRNPTSEIRHPAFQISEIRHPAFACLLIFLSPLLSAQPPLEELNPQPRARGHRRTR